MARKTVRQKITALQKKFPLRTRYGFLHATKRDLTRNYTTIFVVALIFDPERGHSVFIWNPHRRGFDWKAPEWNSWLSKTGLAILAHDVMEAINAKRGSSWQMMRMIGFYGGSMEPKLHVVGERGSAIYQRKNRGKRKGGNKANDKRSKNKLRKSRG